VEPGLFASDRGFSWRSVARVHFFLFVRASNAASGSRDTAEWPAGVRVLSSTSGGRTAATPNCSLSETVFHDLHFSVFSSLSQNQRINVTPRRFRASNCELTLMLSHLSLTILRPHENKRFNSGRTQATTVAEKKTEPRILNSALIT
jgi:hypothetical protein